MHIWCTDFHQHRRHITNIKQSVTKPPQSNYEVYYCYQIYDIRIVFIPYVWYDRFDFVVILCLTCYAIVVLVDFPKQQPILCDPSVMAIITGYVFLVVINMISFMRKTMTYYTCKYIYNRQINTEEYVCTTTCLYVRQLVEGGNTYQMFTIFKITMLSYAQMVCIPNYLGPPFYYYTIHVPRWLLKWLNLIRAPGSVSNEPGWVTWLATKYLKNPCSHLEKSHGKNNYIVNISLWPKINILSSYFNILMLNYLEMENVCYKKN